MPPLPRPSVIRVTDTSVEVESSHVTLEVTITERLVVVLTPSGPEFRRNGEPVLLRHNELLAVVDALGRELVFELFDGLEEPE